MIGKLSGKIDAAHVDYVIIDVGGVGYIVFCSRKTLSNLVVGEYAKLLIETHVREDHIHLYGFFNSDEKHTFILLQSVKGVGTRMALAILSELSPEEIHIALSIEDKTAFHRVSGVGKKLAERIVTELKDKFIIGSRSDDSIQLLPNLNSAINGKPSIVSDAISALTSLGVNRLDAQNRVNAILAQDKDISINELIKLALKGGV